MSRLLKRIIIRIGGTAAIQSYLGFPGAGAFDRLIRASIRCRWFVHRVEAVNQTLRDQAKTRIAWGILPTVVFTQHFQTLEIHNSGTPIPVAPSIPRSSDLSGQVSLLHMLPHSGLVRVLHAERDRSWGPGGPAVPYDFAVSIVRPTDAIAEVFTALLVTVP